MRSRRLPRITIIDGAWWCEGCLASGFTPSRVRHAKKCKGAHRPIAYSPAPVMLDAHSAVE